MGFFKKIGNLAKKAVSGMTAAPRLVSTLVSKKRKLKDFKLFNNQGIGKNYVQGLGGMAIAGGTALTGGALAKAIGGKKLLSGLTAKTSTPNDIQPIIKSLGVPSQGGGNIPLPQESTGDLGGLVSGFSSETQQSMGGLSGIWERLKDYGGDILGGLGGGIGTGTSGTGTIPNSGNTDTGDNDQDNKKAIGVLGKIGLAWGLYEALN